MPLTLEERCISAFRQELLRGDAETLKKKFHECEKVKGGNETGIFEDELRKDVIACQYQHSNINPTADHSHEELEPYI